MTEDEALRLAEALVFASAGPVGARALSQLLPETLDADAVIAGLRERYAGRGVELIGPWFGIGTGRGIALVFTTAGLVGLCVTALATKSKAYRVLSERYLAKEESSE